MEWKLLTKADYVTTGWSGGTTTQLAIAPEGAAYPDRDFLWRVSSASVELEHSDFTPLPDYDRHLAVLDGEIRLKIGENEPISLAPGQIASFDGGVPVESWGRCVDFNLMVRKGKAWGEVSVLGHDREGAVGPRYSWRPGPGDWIVYCAAGTVRLPKFDLGAGAGALLLCRGAEECSLTLDIHSGLAVLAAVRECGP